MFDNKKNNTRAKKPLNVYKIAIQFPTTVKKTFISLRTAQLPSWKLPFMELSIIISRDIKITFKLVSQQTARKYRLAWLYTGGKH